MANEIKAPYNKGSTLYARVFNDTGQVWNTSGTPAFENWADGNVTDYDTALTDKTSGQYIGDFPSCAAGRYKVVVYLQAGANPAITDGIVHEGEILWDGTSEIFRADEDDVSGSHTTTDGLITTLTEYVQGILNIYNET